MHVFQIFAFSSYGLGILVIMHQSFVTTLSPTYEDDFMIEDNDPPPPPPLHLAPTLNETTDFVIL